MRIFPVVVKRITGGGEPAFDSDGTTTTGTEDESVAWDGDLSPQSIGSEAESLAVMDFDLLVPTGSDAASMLVLDTGSGLRSLGTDAESGPGYTGSLTMLSTGSAGASFSASSAITAYEQAGAASRVDLAPAGGDATWANVSNAQAEDGSTSSITLTGSATAARAFSDELRLETYTPGPTPTGWTLTAVELVLRSSRTSLRPGTDLTSTLTGSIVVRYTDTTEVTLGTFTESSSNQALSTAVYALDAAKTVDRIMCRAVCSITIGATTTTFAWNVDAARLRYTYTRSGIT